MFTQTKEAGSGSTGQVNQCDTFHHSKKETAIMISSWLGGH